MSGLLNLAMKAHGGLERWKQVRNMRAKVTLNGTLWQIKGRPDGLSGVVMRLDTKEPNLTITPFPKPGTAGHFTPSRVWIEDANGFSRASSASRERVIRGRDIPLWSAAKDQPSNNADTTNCAFDRISRFQHWTTQYGKSPLLCNRWRNVSPMISPEKT